MAPSSLALTPNLVKFRQSSFRCVLGVQIKALYAGLRCKVKLTNSRTDVPESSDPIAAGRGRKGEAKRPQLLTIAKVGARCLKRLRR
jgi:hypothetical protein